MSNKSYTHILTIVDRSGSMSGREKTMIDALDEYFNGQAEVDGVALVDYVQFDTQYELVFEDRLVGVAKAQLQPRGGTSLLDAIGRGITDLKKKFRKLPKNSRPANVQVVIVTDGYENSSRKWSYDEVSELVIKQTKKGWDFVFLGANMDAVAEGAKLGIGRGSTITFDVDNAAAVGAASSSLTSYTTTYRGGGTAAFTDEDRENAVGNKTPSKS